jgi:hypothetical protein
MIYCIVMIRKCFVGDEYVQNHHDNLKFEKIEDAQKYINNHSARKLGDDNWQHPVPDIRRHIINERGTIYGYYDANDEAHYFSLVEMEETRKNKFLDE